jgi:hypothetical protein
VPDEEVGAKTVATVLAVTDPDGYTFEVTEQSRRDGVSKVILNVSNLDVSVDFYEKVRACLCTTTHAQLCILGLSKRTYTCMAAQLQHSVLCTVVLFAMQRR